jgi:type I restriction enzyme, S subunit
MSAAWPRVSFGELTRLERRPVDVIADRQYQEIGTYSYGRGIFHKQPRSGLEVGNKDLFLMREGDLILQVTFAWEGAIALCSKAEDGLYGSVRYPTFRVNEERCFAPFLAKYLCTRQGLDQIGRICPGSAGRNRVLAIKRLPEIMIPLPPLEEQHRIVARIEQLAAKVGEAKNLRQSLQNELLVLPRALLSQRSSHRKIRVGEFATLRPPDVKVDPLEEYHFAGVYSFGRGVFQGQRKLGSEFAYPKLTRLRARNFVYPKLMAWEGALGVVPPECDGLVVSTEFPVFEIDAKVLLPEVVDTYFRSPELWPSLSGQSGGTNVRRRRLNPNDFLNLQVPWPDQEAQAAIRQCVTRVSSIGVLQSETAVELDAMLPAILDRAFKGEL